MSAPIDVLWVLDALSLQTKQRGGSPSFVTIDEARAAIAELVEDEVSAATPDMPADRRALEIRQPVGSASVKKVYALRGQMTRCNRDAIEQYEAKQRAFEEERYNRLLRTDSVKKEENPLVVQLRCGVPLWPKQPEPANFCADEYIDEEVPDLTWLEMGLVVIGLAAFFWVAALLVTSP